MFVRNYGGCLPDGVTKRPDSDRYQAQIRIDGKRKYLGVYKTSEDASIAYQDAKRLHILDVIKQQRGIDCNTILDVLYERYKGDLSH